MATDYYRLEDSGPMLPMNVLSSFEEQLGGKLPDDYRRFLLTSNGGTPDRAMFRVQRSSQPRELWVDYFFSIAGDLLWPLPGTEPGEPGTMAFWRCTLGFITPQDALMIGSVCTYDRLLLYFRGACRGHLYLLDWDGLPWGPGEWELADAERALQFAAPSFRQFYNSLYNSP